MKAAETLSDALVKLEQIVRPIAWQPTETDAELASTICGVYSVFVCLDDERGEWWEAYSGSGYLSAWSTCDEAKSAAEADYRARIASALNLDAVLSEIKRMREALEPFAAIADKIAQEHPGWDHDAFVFRMADVTMDMSMFRAAREALSTLSPQEPTR